MMHPVHARLAGWTLERARAHGPGFVLGLSGAQGSGKSTLAAALAEALGGEGLRVATLSLDDVYRTRAERERLAASAHPLLITRGPPGTHDVALALRVLEALGRPGEVELPRFDKASDDRRAERERVAAPLDVVLLEGWCLGLPPEPEARLAEPVNALERERDGDGHWRRWVNAELAGAYQRLWTRLDALVLLQAPGWDSVLDWRLEAERGLRARTGGGMSDAAVAEFVAHYERLTRWALETLPERADVRLVLGADREPRWATAASHQAPRKG